MFRIKWRCRSSAAPSRNEGGARTLRRIWKELGWRDAASSVLVILILAVQASAQAAPPLVLRALLDAIPRRDVAAVSQMAAALLTLTLVFTILSLWHRWLSAKVGYGLLHRLQVDLYEHLQRLSLEFFTRMPAGEVQAALTENFAVLRVMVVRGTVPLLHHVFLLLWGAVVLYLLEPSLALIGYSLTPVIVMWSALAGRRSARIAGDERAAASRLSTVAREGMSVDGVIAMKTLGGGKLADRFRTESQTIKDRAMRLDLNVRLSLTPVDFLAVLVTVGVFTFVVLQAIEGRPTPSPATLAVFAGALTVFLYGLKAAMESVLELAGLMGRFQEIFDLLDTEIEIEPGTTPLARNTPGELVFDRVSFRHGPDEPWVLRDVTLRVPAGECVAIVGASGAGKTTIGFLAVRLHDPTEGQVRIDGIDIKELSLDSLHQVGYIPQGPFLSQDTIKANIALGSPDATDQQIVEAARNAQIHDWISALPDGYETFVGTDGYRVSGGQGQRIIIARMVLQNPRLLVLDEATSALDNATQREVDKALRQLGAGRTTLLFAHRLSTVRRATHIVVLDRGRVVESGTHEQLRRLGGKYAELVRAEHT